MAHVRLVPRGVLIHGLFLPNKKSPELGKSPEMAIPRGPSEL